MTSERQYIRRQYTSVYTEDIDRVVKELLEAKAVAEAAGWRKLTLEISDGGDGYYDGSPTLCIYGERLETDTELFKRNKTENEQEVYQRQQYEALKAKYEK